MKDLALPSTVGWGWISPCPLLISLAENLDDEAFWVKRVVIPTSSD